MSHTTNDFPTGRRWLNQREAALYYGVTDRTIRNMIRRGELTGYRVGKRMVRLDIRELDAALRRIPTTDGAA